MTAITVRSKNQSDTGTARLTVKGTRGTKQTYNQFLQKRSIIPNKKLGSLLASIPKEGKRVPLKVIGQRYFVDPHSVHTFLFLTAVRHPAAVFLFPRTSASK
jgi:hypothetical protein